MSSCTATKPPSAIGRCDTAMMRPSISSWVKAEYSCPFCAAAAACSGLAIAAVPILARALSIRASGVPGRASSPDSPYMWT